MALDSKSVAWGAVSLDFDNDSTRDLYVATMKRALAGASNPLFQNDGTGKFAEIGYTSGAGDPGPSVGVATADYDNDGWVDLVVGNYDRGYHLFHNAGLAKDNRWLTLKLVGDGPVNRDAVGARVIVTTADGLTQMQDVHNGSSVGGGSALELYFGLGKSKLETVEIRWPDGSEQVLNDLMPDRAYEVRYGGTVMEIKSS